MDSMWLTVLRVPYIEQMTMAERFQVQRFSEETPTPSSKERHA
jgi:hypothetical protein